jgi:NAD(P)-dependent dehydrogenase (short-subunit alcohol dehydrogenase family)
MNFKGFAMKRTFLITGASKGIGRALSEQLVAEGHTVVGIARNADDPSFPGTLVAADLADAAAVQGVIDSLLQRFQFDGLVNNVGFIKLAPLGEIDLDEMDELFRLNLRPAVQLTQALLPGMRERAWGRIINMSSLVVLGMRDRTAYAGSKAAIVSFTRTWALELAETGITVNSVAPGPTETEMFRQNTQEGSDAERRFLAQVPMKRFGKPAELAASVAFLLSENAGFITGQTLHVDGGASIGKAQL